MNLKKEFLKSMKVALLYASLSTAGLGALTGCTNDNFETSNYETIAYAGNIKYEDLINTKLITTIINDIEETLIVKEVIQDNKIVYMDIVTGNIINNETSSIIYDEIEKSLKKHDMVKESYNTEDIEILKHKILSDPEMANYMESYQPKRTLN